MNHFTHDFDHVFVAAGSQLLLPGLARAVPRPRCDCTKVGGVLLEAFLCNKKMCVQCSCFIVFSYFGDRNESIVRCKSLILIVFLLSNLIMRTVLKFYVCLNPLVYPVYPLNTQKTRDYDLHQGRAMARRKCGEATLTHYNGKLSVVTVVF